jgi:predicted nucleic acid-binding protein
MKPEAAFVIVDTTVWSKAYRRKRQAVEDKPLTDAFTRLVSQTRAVMLGAVRQELLSGISKRNVFDDLVRMLDSFPDFVPLTEDYKRAAEFCNICRSHGVQGSPTDFLICAVAYRNTWSIFTEDNDFDHYKKWLPICLYSISSEE